MIERGNSRLGRVVREGLSEEVTFKEGSKGKKEPVQAMGGKMGIIVTENGQKQEWLWLAYV